jgi:DNA-binding XRE family transcriptional regulator
MTPKLIMEARHHAGLSTAQAAELIGVPESTYLEYEAGTDRIHFLEYGALMFKVGLWTADEWELWMDSEPQP